MRRTLRLAMSVFLSLGLAVTAAAAGLVTSSLMVPFTGLFNPGGTNEPVALTGRVHIVTQLQPGDPCAPGDPCRLFVNLADVKGVGQNSGARYIAIGAQVLQPTDPCTPGDPCTPTDPCIPTDPCRIQFVIMPVSTPGEPNAPANPVMPITFFVVLAFDSTRHLIPNGTIVSLQSTCTTDFCL